MKHHDSIEIAGQKLTDVVKQLQLWNLPATPINYVVGYEYISGKNTQLIDNINQQLTQLDCIDNFFIEEVFKQYLVSSENFRNELIDDLDSLIGNVEHAQQQSTSNVNLVMDTVENNLENFQSNNQAQITQAAQAVKKASRSFQVQQQQLQQQLSAAKIKSNSLRAELDEVKKALYIDRLTGLYNRKALNKHLQQWLDNSANQQVAAIVVSINHLAQVHEKFGELISDVLLNKIAEKVKSYVGESGFPVRSASDEFLILMPDVDRIAANEISEKISQGVEKLRFVSSKSGVRLPKMTVSVAVNDFCIDTNVNLAINETRKQVAQMKNQMAF